jgi:hypothetical protein
MTDRRAIAVYRPQTEGAIYAPRDRETAEFSSPAVALRVFALLAALVWIVGAAKAQDVDRRAD